MPYGQIISPTATPVLPGTYGIVTSAAVPPITATGVVCAVAAGTFGPAATTTSGPSIVKPMFSVNDAARYFGATSNMVNVVRQALLGGATQVLGVRPGPGTSGAAQTKSLNDSAAAPAVDLTALYNGAAPLTFTVRATPGDSSTNQFLVYMDGTLWETFTFVNSASNTGVQNATNLVNAITNGSTVGAGQTTASGFVSAALHPAYAGGAGVTLAAVTLAAATGGTNPTLAAGDYTNAIAAGVLEPVNWQVICTDSETPSVHSSFQAQLDAFYGDGYRRMGIFGQPTSVAFATSLTDATTLNSPLCGYVVNGFTSSAGFTPGTTPQNVQGYQAAARVAGILATCQQGQGLTMRQIPDAAAVAGSASAILEPLTQAQQLQAVQNGSLYFTTTAAGAVAIGKGVTTLTTLGTPPVWAQSVDSGWQKFRRVVTRIFLQNDIYAAWDALMTNPDPRLRPPNNAQGWAQMIATAQGVINRYIANNWLNSGSASGQTKVAVDPTRQPQADYAYFVINNLSDPDGIEEAVLTWSFGGN